MTSLLSLVPFVVVWIWVYYFFFNLKLSIFACVLGQPADPDLPFQMEFWLLTKSDYLLELWWSGFAKAETAHALHFTISHLLLNLL